MKLLFCGDTAQTVDTGKNHLLSDEFQKIVDAHDFTCINFEAAMVPTGGELASKVGPYIIQNPRMAEIVKNCGFDLLCLANNHIMDYGLEGIKTIKSFFSGTAMIGSGESEDEVYKTYIWEKEGTKIGFLNVAENGFGTSTLSGEGGHAWFMHDRVEVAIQELNETCDISVVIAHAGAENWDIPLPEIRRLYKRFIQLGADAVIAHHPHTPQGWEHFENGWIFYSLGNFAFYEGEGRNNPAKTVCVSMTVEGKRIVDCEPIYTEFTEGKVEVCQDEVFIDHMARCNELLKDDECYMEMVNKKCLERVKSDVRMMYSRVLGMYYPLTLKNQLKSFVRRHVMKNKFDDNWLYHNLLIETHLWIAQRGIKILVDQEKVR